MRLHWPRKRAEEPTRARSRGAHLIKANLARGRGKDSPAGWGYIPTKAMQANDKPNTLQGTRR